MRTLGYDVTTSVGGYGVVAILQNGAGPTVLLRTDTDALPVEEKTGPPYASAVTMKNAAGATVPVMHACGHDLHMASWFGTARLMAQNRQGWHGTLMLIAQPAEEIGVGAAAILKDGLFTRFPPAFREIIVRLAMAGGCFSIWWTVFASDSDMRRRLRLAFIGTDAASFDANEDLLPRAGGQL